jgi:hypothetical protein
MSVASRFAASAAMINASAPRSQQVPHSSERHRDRKLGTIAPATSLEAMRPPLAGNNPAHVADSQRSLPRPAVKTSARADSQKRRSPVPFGIASRARERGTTGGGGAGRRRAFLPERGFVMPSRIDLDHTHSRAVVRDIGERLRASLQPEPELPARYKKQIDRLREVKEPSPSIVPGAEHWKKPGR